MEVLVVKSTVSEGGFWPKYKQAMVGSLGSALRFLSPKRPFFLTTFADSFLTKNVSSPTINN